MSSQFCQLVQCVEEQQHGSLGIGVFHIMPVHSEQYQRRTLFIKGTLGKGEKGGGGGIGEGEEEIVDGTAFKEVC